MLCVFLLKHNRINPTFYFIFTFKHVKHCSSRFKISWNLAQEIFRSVQCLEWLLDKPSYLDFSSTKKRPWLEAKPLSSSIKAKKAYSYVTTVFAVFMAWQFSAGRIHVTVLTESCLITWQAFRNLLKQAFKIILPASAPVAWHSHLVFFFARWTRNLNVTDVIVSAMGRWHQNPATDDHALKVADNIPCTHRTISDRSWSERVAQPLE
jgi:hypothetical protein